MNIQISERQYAMLEAGIDCEMIVTHPSEIGRLRRLANRGYVKRKFIGKNEHSYTTTKAGIEVLKNEL